MINSLACINKETPVENNLPSSHLPSPHDRGFENAWIQFIENGLVQIQTIDTKIAILFQPVTDSELKKYHVGWIAPVTFECGGEIGNCDLSRSYKLYIGGALTTPLKIQKRPK